MTAARKALIACGIIAPCVYLSGDIAASIRYDGYVWTDQAVSELFAHEAPTRDLILVVFSVYNLLLLAFAGGIWSAANDRRALKWIAGFVCASALLGIGTDFLAPMHARGVDQGASGAWHAALTGVQVLLILAMLVAGTRVLGSGFRRFTWATLAVLLVAGPLSSLLAGDPATAEETPWFGVAERSLIYTYLLWSAVLAVQLLREPRPARELEFDGDHVLQ